MSQARVVVTGVGAVTSVGFGVDQFAGALAAGSPRDEQRRRLQLKQLLFGMGETFRTLMQKKVEHK